MSKRVGLLWVLAAIASVIATILVFLPASWLALILEKQTAGRLSLGDVRGSFWSGSAFVGGASGISGPVTPLFPGRFSWQISPMLLLGQLDVVLENNKVLSQAVKLNGNLSQWHVAAASLSLPPERLEGLGAPLNTIGPTGQVRLNWSGLDFTRYETKLDVIGKMHLELNDMGSRLSSIKPLGSYSLAFDWHGQIADVVLTSQKGPMLLSGNGSLNAGRFQFSGKAQAETGQEEKLANLLGLLGQRRRDGDKDVIALEFK
ncbi:type II secretion system protein N [Undibacterium sp.]|uniref:type II secretion system protein N n=1 Tax=Undibacterium sp. TaxID=1914977 RepID=UPI0025D31DA5|nr:type II secretion system protein N [Undibacterium sp.]MCX7217732.1 type II secretion system protein N [Burkholderiales bacterium]